MSTNPTPSQEGPSAEEIKLCTGLFAEAHCYRDNLSGFFNVACGPLRAHTTAAVEKREHQLQNILARLFRDAGHKTAELGGIDKAVEFADEHIAQIHADRYRLTRLLAEREKELADAKILLASEEELNRTKSSCIHVLEQRLDSMWRRAKKAEKEVADYRDICVDHAFEINQLQAQLADLQRSNGEQVELADRLAEALTLTNKFIEEQVYTEQGGNEGRPEPADSVSYNAVGHMQANNLLLAAYAAARTPPPSSNGENK